MTMHYEYNSIDKTQNGFLDCKTVLEKWVNSNSKLLKEGLFKILSVSIVYGPKYWRLYIEYTG